MQYTIDMRDKVCPLPVIETKKILQKLTLEDSLEVRVDNVIAVQNLSKLAQQKHLNIDIDEHNTYDYRVHFTLKEKPQKQEDSPITSLDEVYAKEEVNDYTVVVLDSQYMGDGDEKLGHLLMKGFIYALTEQEQLPKVILLYNTGAYLSTQTSDCIADLKLLEAQGVEVLTCGTCLNHYGLEKDLAVGSVTNMYVIVEKQMEATKVIKP